MKTKCKQQAIIRSAKLLEKIQRLYSLADSGESFDLSTLTWEVAASPEVKPKAPPLSEVTNTSPKLSKVFERYRKMQLLDGVSEKTLDDKRSVMSLLIRIVGDLPVSKYQRSHANKFKDTSLQLPTEVNRKGDVSIQQLIDNAKFNISTTIFNNYIKNIITVFVYAIREGLCLTNPFEGLKLKQRIKMSAQRRRFTEGDLKHLFATDIYTGRKASKDYQYWLPLLGAYTGARMSEICQLYLGDIKSVNGIDYIHVQATHVDQKLKDPSSERLVPIHSKLIALGFMEFVANQRTQGHSRLFPELILHRKHGYAATPSKWFANLRTRLGFTGGDEKKDFHSFRHTAADHLKQLGVPESIIGGILGHQTGGITFNRYGKDYKPETLASAIEMLDFNFTVARFA
ncbi:MAG: site-specific integrase [Pseudomonadales bacterium]|nr:site-specific integrase [Pseudomonadales bacterium]